MGGPRCEDSSSRTARASVDTTRARQVLFSATPNLFLKHFASCLRLSRARAARQSSLAAPPACRRVLPCRRRTALADAHFDPLSTLSASISLVAPLLLPSSKNDDAAHFGRRPPTLADAPQRRCGARGAGLGADVQHKRLDIDRNLVRGPGYCRQGAVGQGEAAIGQQRVLSPDVVSLQQ